MLSCLQLPEGLEHNAKLYRFFIGYRCHFQDPSKPAQTKLVKPIRKVSGFLGLRAESEANETQKEKRRTLFLQEERMQKLLNPFTKEIPLVPYFINLIKKK